MVNKRTKSKERHIRDEEKKSRKHIRALYSLQGIYILKKTTKSENALQFREKSVRSVEEKL